MINTLTLFRGSRPLFWVAAGFFMIVLPIGVALISLSRHTSAQDMTRSITADTGLGVLMGMIIVASLVTADAKHGMVRYYAMTGESRLRHFVVRIASATVLWCAITAAVSLVMFAIALLGHGSHAGLVTTYLPAMGGRLIAGSFACIAMGSIALLLRNAGTAVGIGIIFVLIVDQLLTAIPRFSTRWPEISPVNAVSRIAHSSDSNLVVNGIVVTLAWLAALSVTGFLVEQRRDM